jgi:hypothetical protein
MSENAFESRETNVLERGVVPLCESGTCADGWI